MSNIMKYEYEKFYTICSISLLCVILLSCERSVSVSPPDEPPPDGCLFINSSPSDARIFLNGKDRRRTTPDSITWLATNDYEVTLRKEYFRDTSFMIHVTEGGHSEIFVDYLSNPAMFGQIECISNPPGALIYLDGENTSEVTPAFLEGIIPGIHIIRYIKDEHKETELSVIVRSNQSSRSNMTLVNTNVWKEYNVNNSAIPSDYLTDILIDQREIIWVGTLEDGLVEINNGTWINYRESNSNISNDFIRCIEEGPHENIWVGTFDGIFEIRYPEGTFLKWNAPLELRICINDIKKSGSSKIWFATDAGLISLLLSNVYTWGMPIDPTNSLLPEKEVIAIGISGFHKWVGTESYGVVDFTNMQNMRIHNTLCGLQSNNASAIEIDRVGVAWIGHQSGPRSRGGLSRYNGAGWDNLSHLIYGEDVTDMYVDSKNQKWIATNRALYRLVNSSILDEYNYDSTGLYLDNIQGICEDSEGNIWLATSGDGIIRINTNKLLN